MGYYELPPPSGTHDLVRALWWNGDAPGTLVLPDGCTDIVFSPLRRSMRVVGVMTRAVISMPPERELLGLRLQPWATRAFFGVSADRLRDRAVDLAELSPNLYRSFSGVDGLRSLVNALGDERWRRAVSAVDHRVRDAVSVLELATHERVDALASTASTSDRHLHRLFVANVGLAPKVFARVMRLRNAVRSCAEPVQLATVATRAGYADQAHFCRDTKILTGLSPRQVLARVAHLNVESDTPRSPLR